MDLRKILNLIKKVFFHPFVFLRYFYRYTKAGLKQYTDNNLFELGAMFKTDKGVPGHSYMRVYDAFLRNRRSTVNSLCEIGLLQDKLQRIEEKDVYQNSPSLSIWCKYFPKASITGFDIKKFKQPLDKNTTIIQGDQSSRKDLQKIVDYRKEFDVIIDDGFHASKHQQISLSFLFKFLKSGGVYFIEDLRFQPKEFETNEIKTLDPLKELSVNGKWNSPFASSEEKRVLEKGIKEIHFFDSLKSNDSRTAERFNDAIAVILKK